MRPFKGFFVVAHKVIHTKLGGSNFNAVPLVACKKREQTNRRVPRPVYEAYLGRCPDRSSSILAVFGAILALKINAESAWMLENDLCSD